MCILTAITLSSVLPGLAAIASVSTSLVGGIVETVSSVRQAEQAADMAEYQANLAEQNRKLALRQAEQTDLQGNQERNQLRLRMLDAKGEARNAYAASGVVLGSGSSADYEADIADAYDLDSRNLEYDIASRKWKLQMEAANYANQGALYRSQAAGYRQSRTTSLLGGIFNTAGSTVESGVSGFLAGNKLAGALG